MLEAQWLLIDWTGNLQQLGSLKFRTKMKTLAITHYVSVYVILHFRNRHLKDNLCCTVLHHGGEGHVLLGIIVLVDQTLMLVVDHFGDGWESLIKGEVEYNTLVGRAGGLQKGVSSV